MDPLSLTVSITSLILGCAKITKVASDLRSQYKRASLTLSSIATECTAVTTALSHLQSTMLLHNAVEAPDLMRTTDCVVAGCTLTLSVLDEYLQEINYTQDSMTFEPPHLTRREKIGTAWNESEMRELLQQLQGHKSSIMLILTMSQRYVTTDTDPVPTTSDSSSANRNQGFTSFCSRTAKTWTSCYQEQLTREARSRQVSWIRQY